MLGDKSSNHNGIISHHIREKWRIPKGQYEFDEYNDSVEFLVEQDGEA